MAANRSGVAFRYTIELVGGEQIEVQTIAADVMRWEANHKGEAFLGQTGAPSVLRMMEVAYYAARRLHLTEVKPFDRWRDQVEDFEIHDDDSSSGGEDDDLPTRPDQSDD